MAPLALRQAAARQRLYPPQLLKALASRLVDIAAADKTARHSSSSSGGGRDTDTGTGGSSGGEGSLVLAPSLQLQVASRLLHCFARLPPTAELSPSLTKRLVRLAVAEATPLAAQLTPSGVARPGAGSRGQENPAPGGREQEQPQGPVEVRTEQGQEMAQQQVAVARLEELLCDVQAVCDRLRPGPRNAVLDEAAALRALLDVVRSPDTSLQVRRLVGKAWRVRGVEVSLRINSDWGPRGGPQSWHLAAGTGLGAVGSQRG